MPIYCPGCAMQLAEDVRFCKKCGTNVLGVKGAIQSREPDERFDWSKTWLAEMLLTEDERERRRVSLELTGRAEDLVAAELKRVNDLQNEIKAGVITMFVGIGLAIFLNVFMATVAAAQDDPKTAMILSSIWVAGVIPLMIGAGMLVNALFVGRRFATLRQDLLRSVVASPGMEPRGAARATGELPALDAPPFEVPSVTEHTTHHLSVPESALRPERRRE